MEDQNSMRIGFIGQGYVGKNYADDFEQRGFDIVRYSLEEPYINNKKAVGVCDIVFIAVPTPTAPPPQGFDVSIVEQMLTYIEDGKIAVIKSTVLPGLTKQLQGKFPKLVILFSPEFLREVSAAHDAAHPHAIIIGMPVDDERHKNAAQKLLSVLPPAPVKQIVGSTEAEMIKYTQNIVGYGDILMFNILYDLAQKLGANWESVREGLVADPHIARHFANPVHKSGRGAGGHCLIKDFAAIRMLYEQVLPEDTAGVGVLRALEAKNNDLLTTSNKDIDLMRGVYGDSVKSNIHTSSESVVPKHIFIVFGTRPEAIKFFPLIHRLKREPSVTVTVCVTAQHRDMLDPVLRLTNIVPDIDLNLMQPNQSLDSLSSQILLKVGEALDRVKPDRVMVLGDTTSAMFGALAAHYRRIPVSHIEAGLRSGNIYAPWPEEINRKVITSIADQHFAPTLRAAEQLQKENVPKETIYMTGNTVVDALLTVRTFMENTPALAHMWDYIREHQSGRRIILVTSHRRENFGDGMQHIADALLKILERKDVAIVLPLHANPKVQDVLGKRLKGHPQVEMIAPQEYANFVSLLNFCDIVLTDSGGIQEEAPAFGKPVLVMRETTERPEGVEAGTALLVGTDTDKIVAETCKLLDDKEHYERMSRAHNPFGDGHAAERIINIILKK
jgi:UDP-N-acetylglucosamine 2-epimerase (non-hydrolysing)